VTPCGPLRTRLSAPAAKRSERRWVCQLLRRRPLHCLCPRRAQFKYQQAQKKGRVTNCQGWEQGLEAQGQDQE